MRGTKMLPEWIEECKRVKRLLDIEKQRSGLTQRMLGEMIGKSPKTVSAMINGRARVTLDTARALSDVFGVPLREIIPWTDDLLNGDDADKYGNIMQDLKDMSDENRAVAMRMIKKIRHSQELS